MKVARSSRLRIVQALLLAAALLIAACLFTACLFDGEKTAMGGGSDTETLTGLIASPDGKPSTRMQVKLIPVDYNPSHPDTTLILRALTDNAGRYRFEKLAKGKTYNLIAGNAAGKSWTFAPDLPVGTAIGNLTLASAKVFLFEMHTENYVTADSGIAYFPGTDILTRCNGINYSSVDSVPMGALRFVVESRAGWAHDTTLASAAVKDTAKVIATQSGVMLYP